MAKKILVSYDFNKNEIQNAVAQVLASAPGSPAVGQFYYDSTAGRLLYRGAAAWIDPTDRATHTGTQAWSTLTATPTTLAGYGITDAQASSAQLTSLAALATNGLIARTASNTVTARSLASSTAAATWTNADGVSGNPSLAIANAVAAGNAGLMTGADKTKLDGIATGATANSSDATLLNRANHTGTQTASTISNFDTQVRTSRLDQMAAPTAAVAMNSQKLTGLADGTNAQDAATFGQLQSVLNGRQFKDAVLAATTANITLSGTQTIDTVSLAAGDRVLVKNQSTGSQNGIYVVDAGAWSRSTDADNSSPDSEVKTGMSVFVSEGSANGDKIFSLTTNGIITIDTTALTFAATGAGTTYTQGTGISIAGDVVSIDTAVVVRKYATSIGNGSATSIAVTHGLGSLDVNVQVYENSTGETVECDVARTSTSQVTLGFAVAPTTNQYRVLVHG